LAQFLYDAFEQHGRPIPWKRAVAVFSETMSYADRLGYPEFFEENLIWNAVTGVSESPTRKRVVHFFKLGIAQRAYPQESPAVRLLCDLIQRKRLPSERVYRGEKQRRASERVLRDALPACELSMVQFVRFKICRTTCLDRVCQNIARIQIRLKLAVMTAAV
jgi:hypothetical protein